MTRSGVYYLADWLRARWTEARWGLLYVGFVFSFVTATTVTYTDLPFVSTLFPSFAVYAVVGFISGGLVAAPLVGYFHGRYQNPIDVRKAQAPLLEEIRKILREELNHG